MKNFFKKIFNSRKSSDSGNFDFKCRQLLGFTPHKIDRFETAFTHRSFSQNDRFGNPINYERLEFLGDAVLGTIIAEYLYKYAPFADEGYLTQMRSKIVSRVQLNGIGKAIGLDNLVKSSFSKNQFPEDVYGDMVEALIGAIYIDQGYETAKKFIYDKIIIPYVDLENLEHKVASYKSLLIEWAQKSKHNIRFELSEGKNSDHSHEFGVKFILDGKYISKGRGISKKKAEESAAKRAYYALRTQIDEKN